MHGLLLVTMLALQPLGIELQGYDYPYIVRYFSIQAQKQDLRMAYMDIAGQKPNGKVVMLFHGKNFFGAYWKEVIAGLTAKGFRVIVPDQIGFGKSSKPENFQFTFHQLAANSKALLDHLGITKSSLAGHSMGGMLAVRFSLMYPDMVEKLILENPIGLEDYKLKVPYTTPNDQFKEELQVTLEKLVDYQKTNYYHGTWKPEYMQWVEPIFRMSMSREFPRMAWNSALTYEMIYTQPVVYELRNINVRTLLLIGQLDRSAVGKNRVSKEVAETMGNFPQLGKQAQKEIPGARLIELEEIGHVPHIEAFSRFFESFVNFLEN